MAIDLKRSDTLRGLFVWWLAFVPMAALSAEWQYTVRPGDEIWNIASRYCGSPSFATRIMSLNQLADDRRLRPGTRLRIPVDWLVRQPATARVAAVRGAAWLLNPDRQPARVGQTIEMGHRLETQEGSVVVEFADGSSLFVADESEVLFNVLTAYGDTGMVDTNLRFYRGRGTSKVIRRNDASSFRISSPAGTAAVRGTEFRVAVEPDRSLTETQEGEVGFLRDVETAVPAGFGLAAGPAGDVSEPLLPAPAWVSTPDRYAVGSEIHWSPLSGAQGYRVGIYDASDPQTPVRSSVVPAAMVRLGELSPARYVVKVRGISTSDLEGYESALAVELMSPAPRPDPASEFTSGSTVLAWRTEDPAPYSVEVATDPAFSDIVWHKEVDASSAVVALGAGRYHWRVRSRTSAFCPPGMLTVRPEPPAGLSVTRELMTMKVSWLPSSGASYRVRIARDPGFQSLLLDTMSTDVHQQLVVPNAGHYHVSVAAIENGVESQPESAEIFMVRRPWWLLGLLVVPFLL